MRTKEIPNGKICSRKGCEDLATVKHGRSTYCEKHYRFKRMRDVAQQSGKSVPSWEKCEELLQPCLNEDGTLGKCPSCHQQMQWRAGADKKSGPTISLQHNHDTTECMVCTRCNAGHGKSKLGDRYLEPTPEGFKHCGECDTIKPLAQFHKERMKGSGLQGCCKSCRAKHNRQYYHTKVKTNPELLAKERERKRKYYHTKVKTDPEFLAKARERSRKYRDSKKVANHQLELAI